MVLFQVLVQNVQVPPGHQAQQGDGEVPALHGFVDLDGVGALEGLRQQGLVVLLRHLGGGEPQHGGRHGHRQQGDTGGGQHRDLFGFADSHVSTLLFQFAGAISQQVRRPLLKIRGKGELVESLSVIVHTTSSLSICRSRSRPRARRVPTVAAGRPSSLAISLMEYPS